MADKPAYLLHASILLAVLVMVQIPRISGRPNAMTAPVYLPDRGYADFDEAYYRAGRMIGRGSAVEIYAAESTAEDSGYFVNVPIVAWLFAPLALLPKGLAGDVFLALNVAASVASLLLLLQRVAAAGTLAHYALTLAFATSGPLISALNLGQTTPLVLLLLLGGERALRSERDSVAGIALATAALIKVPLLAFLPYFAYRRRWRLVAVCATVIVAVMALSLALHGLPMHKAYLDAAFARHFGRALPSHNCQSIAAVVARLSTDAPLWTWQPVGLPPPAALVHWASVGAVLAVAGAALRRRGPIPYARMMVELALVFSASLLVAPVYWSHYGVWLLPAAVAAAGAGAATVTLPRLCAVVVAVLLINIPIPPRPLIERFSGDLWFRFLISHQAAGTLLLFVVCAWRLVKAADSSEDIGESEALTEGCG